MAKSDQYDAIIVGAGVGGLVCGGYLAKAGCKVLLLEKHSQPGGCCSSFQRQGYLFDVGPHYLGSLRPGGILRNILRDLEIEGRIEFLTNDLTDRIITPDKEIHIYKNQEKTQEEFIRHFPAEHRGINNFFRTLLSLDISRGLVANSPAQTFAQVLDQYFSDPKLKAVFSVFLGNIGLPPSQASGFIPLIVLREFILDGGYYPAGGMRALPNALVKCFQKNGGTILYRKNVKEIILQNQTAQGVAVASGEKFFARFVVSGIDAGALFRDQISEPTAERESVERLKPSMSAVVLFLGLKSRLADLPKHFTTWYFPTYDIEQCYRNQIHCDSREEIPYLICTFPSLIDASLAPEGKNVLRVFVGARPGQDPGWQKNKKEITGRLLQKLKAMVPDILDLIEVKEIGTPDTFHRYTGNQNGSIFGWAALPDQTGRKVFPLRTSVENLYLTGHWTTTGIGQSGVATVAFAGKDAAQMIIGKNKRLTRRAR
ncbi:MAG: NAD(P)/FAD-dependent oxidoreductase [Candidatus Omnitrophica bacterium]|nr:NAD(P)/FAD-dependent oxidoreductase [Candidatus Omnitrophota bacterium]